MLHVRLCHQAIEYCHSLYHIWISKRKIYFQFTFDLSLNIGTLSHFTQALSSVILDSVIMHHASTQSFSHMFILVPFIKLLSEIKYLLWKITRS